MPTSYEHVVAIAETLSEGVKYLEERDIDCTPSMELQTALVVSVDVELAEFVHRQTHLNHCCPLEIMPGSSRFGRDEPPRTRHPLPLFNCLIGCCIES